MYLVSLLTQFVTRANLTIDGNIQDKALIKFFQIEAHTRIEAEFGVNSAYEESF